MIAKQEVPNSSCRLPIFPVVPLLCAIALLTTRAEAADVFTVGTAQGGAGTTGVTVPLLATHDDPMQGFSVALSFDPTPLELVAVEPGSAVDALLAGSAPDYFEALIDNAAGTLRVGVIFGFQPLLVPELPAATTTPDEILNLVFDIAPVILPVSVPLVLEPSLGTPSVASVYSYNGFSRIPALEDGSIEVSTLVGYSFDPVSVVPGGSFVLVLRLDHEQEEVGGFQVALTYDSTVLTLAPPANPADYWAQTNLASGIAPETVELFEVSTQAAVPSPGVGFFSVASVFDASTPFNLQSLDPALGDSILRIPFTVANDPLLVGQTTTITFASGISPANPGGPPLPPAENIVITTAGAGIPPVTEDGVISFLDSPSFQRGDANNDGALDVGDPIFLLAFLFNSSITPVCGDATDANDDGNGDIGDAIYSLSYLFNQGPEPPFPFGICGTDATPSTNLLPCPAGTVCP